MEDGAGGTAGTAGTAGTGMLTATGAAPILDVDIDAFLSQHFPETLEETVLPVLDTSGADVGAAPGTQLFAPTATAGLAAPSELAAAGATAAPAAAASGSAYDTPTLDHGFYLAPTRADWEALLAPASAATRSLFASANPAVQPSAYQQVAQPYLQSSQAMPLQQRTAHAAPNPAAAAAAAAETGPSTAADPLSVTGTLPSSSAGSTPEVLSLFGDGPLALPILNGGTVVPTSFGTLSVPMQVPFEDPNACVVDDDGLAMYSASSLDNGGEGTSANELGQLTGSEPSSWSGSSGSLLPALEEQKRQIVQLQQQLQAQQRQQLQTQMRLQQQQAMLFKQLTDDPPTGLGGGAGAGAGSGAQDVGKRGKRSNSSSRNRPGSSSGLGRGTRVARAGAAAASAAEVGGVGGVGGAGGLSSVSSEGGESAGRSEDAMEFARQAGVSQRLLQRAQAAVLQERIRLGGAAAAGAKHGAAGDGVEGQGAAPAQRTAAGRGSFPAGRSFPNPQKRHRIRNRKLASSLDPEELARTREANRVAAQRHRQAAKERRQQEENAHRLAEERNIALRDEVARLNTELGGLKMLVGQLYGNKGGNNGGSGTDQLDVKPRLGVTAMEL